MALLFLFQTCQNHFPFFLPHHLAVHHHYRLKAYQVVLCRLHCLVVLALKAVPDWMIGLNCLSCFEFHLMAAEAWWMNHCHFADHPAVKVAVPHLDLCRLLRQTVDQSTAADHCNQRLILVLSLIDLIPYKDDCLWK